MDENALGHRLAQQLANSSENSAKAHQMLDFSFGWNRRLISLAELRYEPDEFTEVMTRFVREPQMNDGSWISWGRPPLEESRWAETAWGIRAMMLYPIVGEEKRSERSIQRSLKWLRRETPRTNNERSSQLLGLGWGGVSPDELRSHAGRLLAEQRDDGGWALSLGAQ